MCRFEIFEIRRKISGPNLQILVHARITVAFGLGFPLIFMAPGVFC
jgi:hypothetical protein